MKNGKNRLLSAVLALLMISSLTACSKDDTITQTEITTTTEAETEWTGDNVVIEPIEEVPEEVDISGQTIIFLGTADINPKNNNPERSVPLTLFEDVYGAKVEYWPTTYNTRFDDLATNIVGGTPPDIFQYEWLAFPYGVSKGQYQPIDDLVDLNNPLWSDMKGVADNFVMDSKHYVAPLGYRFKDIQVLMYNRDLYEEEGLDDPYELYLEDKWDWDAFVKIMKNYVDNNKEDRMGIAGWWANAFVFTAGETMISYDGKTFKNNLNSPAIEKAETILEDLSKNELIKTGWTSDSESFANDYYAYYGMGTWAYHNAQKQRDDVTIQIVPFPKQPGSSVKYTSNALDSYLWVKGSEKADAVKIWLECCRKEHYEPSYLDAAKAKWLTNYPTWSEEMYDLVMEFYDPDKFTQVFDYGYGISQNMSNTDVEGSVIATLYEGIANGKVENWAQCKEEYSNIVDEEIAVYNN